MNARRRTAWTLLSGFVAATVLPGLYTLHLLRRAEASFDGHRADIAAWTEDVPVRKSSRTAVLEPAEAGNAWDLLGPALDAVGNLYPIELGEYQETRDPNLDWRGIPGDTPRLIQEATPAMELCRRAMRRSELEWAGPVDPDLPAKAGRMSRALCTKAAYALKAGQDSEAAEWLIVALGVAQDAARLGQRGTWDVLHVVEKWACQEARLLLARHDLSVQDLTVLGSRLDVLRSTRPRFGLKIRVRGALQRAGVLAGEEYVMQPTGLPNDFKTVLLDETVGWKDLFSKTILRARVLNGIRAAADELAELEWKLPMLPDEHERILSRYPEHVAYLAFDSHVRSEEYVCLLRRSMFRAAVAFAAVLAETGRFPASAQEAGLPSDLGHPLNIKDGEIDGLSGNLDMDLVWTIKRRTKD